jgi:hypothetical protein
MNLLKKIADVQMIGLFFQIRFIYNSFMILSQQLKIKLAESTFMLLIACCKNKILYLCQNQRRQEILSDYYFRGALPQVSTRSEIV